VRRLLDPGSWQVQFKRLPPRQMLEYHSAGREQTGLWNEAGATHSTIKQVGMTRKATIWWLVNATLYEVWPPTLYGKSSSLFYPTDE
jgi:hypothetical protein